MVLYVPEAFIDKGTALELITALCFCRIGMELDSKSCHRLTMYHVCAKTAVTQNCFYSLGRFYLQDHIVSIRWLRKEPFCIRFNMACDCEVPNLRRFDSYRKLKMSNGDKSGVLDRHDLVRRRKWREKNGGAENEQKNQREVASL
ncbi:hypothetical protein BP00DRAFT_248832 [Aspergillus indologenus CBS 114.80]|uniref:Uncharacterized protein n=1 Tax=Aspergillus indologenus CBS 114.80 TaxID=1450541 RepID=A0A2V5I3U4_9EURO|nr:hypothetical protein BP00DRAFT_248832 [Aspergillus indologenus CBS 114.80]